MRTGPSQTRGSVPCCGTMAAPLETRSQAPCGSLESHWLPLWSFPESLVVPDHPSTTETKGLFMFQPQHSMITLAGHMDWEGPNPQHSWLAQSPSPFFVFGGEETVLPHTQKAQEQILAP